MRAVNNIWCTVHRLWYERTCDACEGEECIAAAELPDWSAFPNRTTATAAAPCINQSKG